MDYVIAVDTPLGVCWVTVNRSDFDKFLSCYEGLETMEDCEETCGYVRHSKTYIYDGYSIATKYWLVVGNRRVNL